MLSALQRLAVFRPFRFDRAFLLIALSVLIAALVFAFPRRTERVAAGCGKCSVQYAETGH